MTDHVYLDFLIRDTNNGHVEWSKDGNKYRGIWSVQSPFRGSNHGAQLDIVIEQIGDDFEYGLCVGGRTMANSKVYKLVKLINNKLAAISI